MSGTTYLRKMEMNVLNLEPSLWCSSGGAEDSFGCGEADMILDFC